MSGRKGKNGESTAKSGPGAGRIYQYRLRMNESEKAILDRLYDKTGIPKSTLMRIAIQNLEKKVDGWNIPKSYE